MAMFRNLMISLALGALNCLAQAFAAALPTDPGVIRLSVDLRAAPGTYLKRIPGTVDRLSDLGRAR
jgi:hypothetical protein